MEILDLIEGQFVPRLPPVRPGWVASLDPSAIAAWDFVSDRAYRLRRSQSLAEAIEYERGGLAYALDSSGIFQPFGTNVLRRTDLGVLIEAASTRMTTYPEPAGHWWQIGASMGTPGGTALLVLENIASAISAGETWNQLRTSMDERPELTGNEFYGLSLIYKAGTSGRIRFGVGSESLSSELSGAVGSVTVEFAEIGGMSDLFDIALDDGWRWLGVTIEKDSTESCFLLAGPDSASVGETVLIAAGWIETDAPSSPILYDVTGTPTRPADALTLKDPGGTYDITFVFDDDSDQTFSSETGDYAVPTNLNRRVIKHAFAVPA